MRNLLVALVFIAALFAGCSGSRDSGGAEPTPPTPAEMYAPIVTPVVHGPDARVLPMSAYPGEIPVLAEHYVAERGGGEPTIAIDRDGVAIYPSIAFDVPAGATNLASTRVMRSSDEGRNWTDATPTLGNLGQVRAAPTSLDPYVYADPVTGRLFNIDLNLAAGGFLSWSDDGAQTWMSNPACCGLPVDDHQTLFSGPATTLVATPLYPGRIVYFCVNQIASSSCTHSLDGGLTFSGATSAFPGVEPRTDNPQSPLCGGLHGHGHASEATGTVFLPKGQCGIPTVARSEDNGLTWEVVRLSDSYGIDGHEAIVSTDRAGNVYYFFLDGDTLPRLSVSRDDGRTWSEPMNVTAPGVTTAKFPSIVAGEEGKIAFLYVGSTTPVGRHLDEREPCNDNDPMTPNRQCPLLHPAERENATWNTYVGFSLDALSDSPVFATVTAHPADDPVMRGSCAGRCQVNGGGMYDFLDIDVNPLTGQVWVAYVDNCNDDTPYHSAPCNGPEGRFDSYLRARAAVGVQVGGTLLGTRLP
ncbi:MAG: hypothetical protein QOC71_987 [Thermoplasmata archaeon]|jgi:hypothetical protein|nr:hypothetical protein [Thermoplasmata archaeon]